MDQRGPAGDGARSRDDRPADRHPRRRSRPRHRGPDVPGLPQSRRLRRNAQPARDHLDGAMRLGRRGARGRAHPRRVAAKISRRRRGAVAGAHLWLRHRHRGGRGGDPHPHPAQHRRQSELRRRGDGGEPRLREAAALPAFPGSGDPRPRAAAGRPQHGLRRHDPQSDGDRGGASREAERPHPRAVSIVGADCRAAMRRLGRLLGRHRQPGAGHRQRHAGARGGDRDVLGSDRGARRHRPADRARGHARSGAGP